MSIFFRTVVLAAGLWLVGTVHPVLAASCDSPAIDQAAVEVRQARVELAALPVDQGAQPMPLGPQAQASISAMKARLGDFLDAYMHCERQDLDMAVAQNDLEHWFEQTDLEPIGPIHYGDHLTVAVARPVNQPGLVAITAEFAIPCGTDTVLFIFAPDGREWKEVLRWQSHPYPEINGAFAFFGYAISPSDAAGRWFLVTKTVAPWCSSTWSMIRYAVLRPRPDRVMPKTLFAAEDSIWWGGEDFGQLAITGDSFDLRFHAQSIDLGIHDRLWVRHFAVDGDQVRRSPPIAVSPRDFVDEWIISTWAQAQAWSKAEARRRLKPWHTRLQALRHFEYGAIRHCGDQADRYQVELTPENEDGDLYLQVEGPASAFQMTGVATGPDPSCGGRDLLETMATH
jgi:hypothetical protein